jgi:hypothetical protein
MTRPGTVEAGRLGLGAVLIAVALLATVVTISHFSGSRLAFLFAFPLFLWAVRLNMSLFATIVTIRCIFAKCIVVRLHELMAPSAMLRACTSKMAAEATLPAKHAVTW